MGNAIKNFEKKNRKKRKEDYKEMQRIVHNAIMEKYPITREIKEKEAEVFDALMR